jgi:phage baseplate assembly protein gpV
MYDVNKLDASGNPSAVTSVSVGAHDAAFLLRATSLPDVTPPTVTASAPTNGASVSTGQLAISGSAADNVGIASVRVAIQNTDTGDWWHSDGKWGSYQSQATKLTTSGSSATWKYTWQPTPGHYALTAIAFDPSANGVRLSPEVDFTVVADTTPPTLTVTSPTPGQLFTTRSTTFIGSAADNVGVAEVDVAVKNETNGLWYHADGTWGSFVWINSSLNQPNAPTTGWSYPWRAPASGGYELMARATDAAGNISTPTQVFFSMA